jgi:hypothetical protein
MKSSMYTSMCCKGGAGGLCSVMVVGSHVGRAGSRGVVKGRSGWSEGGSGAEFATSATISVKAQKYGGL